MRRKFNVDIKKIKKVIKIILSEVESLAEEARRVLHGPPQKKEGEKGMVVESKIMIVLPDNDGSIGIRTLGKDGEEDETHRVVFSKRRSSNE